MNKGGCIKKVYLKTQPFKDALVRKNLTIGEVDSKLISYMSAGTPMSPKMRARIQEVTGMEWDDLFEFAEEKK